MILGRFFSRTIMIGLFLIASIAQARPRSCAAQLFVVGLGNPGFKSARGNAGATLLDEMIALTGAQSDGLDEWEVSQTFMTAKEAKRFANSSPASQPRVVGNRVDYRIGGEVFVVPKTSHHSTLVFVKPSFEFTQSGEFVAQLRDDLGLSLEQFVILVDDVDLSRRELRLSVGNIGGGEDLHNGIRSFNRSLQDSNYARLRIGISSPEAERENSSLTSWVAAEMPEADLRHLRDPQRVEAVLRILQNVQARLVQSGASDQQALKANIFRLLNLLNDPT